MSEGIDVSSSDSKNADREEISPPRQLTLIDCLVLVGFTGLAFAASRRLMIQPVPLYTKAFELLPALLVAWTLAALVLRFRQSRPDLQALTRQPGAAALFATTSILALGLIPVVIASIMRLAGVLTLQNIPTNKTSAIGGGPIPRMGPDWYVWIVSLVLPIVGYIGPAIVGVWIVLALSGRRRPEASWIDYFARLVGSLWIALFIAHLFADIASRYRL